MAEADRRQGLHLMAPLAARITHDQAHKIAHRLVSELAARFPGKYILSAQARRSGRIFLDYLRNGRGTTAIGTWAGGKADTVQRDCFKRLGTDECPPRCIGLIFRAARLT